MRSRDISGNLRELSRIISDLRVLRRCPKLVRLCQLVQRYELHWCRAVGASGQVMTQRCLERASLQERADGRSLQSYVADHAEGCVLPSNARQRAPEQFPRRYDLAIGPWFALDQASSTSACGAQKDASMGAAARDPVRLGGSGLMSKGFGLTWLAGDGSDRGRGWV